MAFGRIVQIRVSDRNGVTRVWDAKLAIKGEVIKSNDSEPDTSSVTLFNLNPTSRKWLQNHGKVMTVVLGHGVNGRVVRSGRVFFGDVRRVMSMKDGVDWRTEIEAEDGALAWQSRTNRSMRRGETYQRLFEALAEDLGLPLGYIAVGSDVAITSGITMDGMTRHYLDKVCGVLGLEWVIQSGSLVVRKPGVPLPGLAVPVNSDTGLVGTAELNKEDDDPGVKFTSVLNVQLVPGTAILCHVWGVDVFPVRRVFCEDEHRLTGVRPVHF